MNRAPSFVSLASAFAAASLTLATACGGAGSPEPEDETSLGSAASGAAASVTAVAGDGVPALPDGYTFSPVDDCDDGAGWAEPPPVPCPDDPSAVCVYPTCYCDDDGQCFAVFATDDGAGGAGGEDPCANTLPGEGCVGSPTVVEEPGSAPCDGDEAESTCLAAVDTCFAQYDDCVATGGDACIAIIDTCAALAESCS